MLLQSSQTILKDFGGKIAGSWSDTKLPARRAANTAGILFYGSVARKDTPLVMFRDYQSGATNFPLVKTAPNQDFSAIPAGLINVL